MKTTMYELLGMVKDGKAPARILYDGYIWSWTGDDYKTILRDEKEQFLITGTYYEWFTDFIKAEVEILEEPKGIPEKLDDILRIDDLEPPYDDNLDKIWRQTIKNQNKINEIIDCLEYLESKGE